EVDFNPFKNFPGRSAVTRLLENRPFRFPEKVFPLMQRSFLSQRVISIDYEQLTHMACQMLQGGQPGCRFSGVLKPHAKTRTGERRELTSLTAHIKGTKIKGTKMIEQDSDNALRFNFDSGTPFGTHIIAERVNGPCSLKLRSRFLIFLSIILSTFSA